MQMKNRLFPYPVLNDNTYVSAYDNRKFELIFEEEDSAEFLVLKNIHIDTDSETLKGLFYSEKIKIACVVECSDTIQRKKYEISFDNNLDIRLKKSEFSKKVFISAYAYAARNFAFSSSEVNEAYQNISFDIEKYDILAANNGYSIEFNHEDLEDSVASSIFTIIQDLKAEEGVYSTEYTGNKINIFVSQKDYMHYKTIYKARFYREVFFNMLLIPALTEALTKFHVQLASQPEMELDDISDSALWFGSIKKAYLKHFGKELTKELYLESAPIILAQRLLGKPFGPSLENLLHRETQERDD